MTKTNFKCMYLVDDRFYKKSLEANILQNQNINTNSVHSKSYVYLPSHINDEIDIDPPKHIPKKIDQTTSTDIEKTDQPLSSVKMEHAGERSRQITPEASINQSSARIDPHVSTLSNADSEPMDFSEHTCDCQKKNAQGKFKEGVEKVKNPGDIQSHFEQDFSHDKDKKIERDNDNHELNELRQRFKKIKEDTDYPISKIVSETANSKQTESKDSGQVVTPHKQSPQNKKYIKQSSNTNESRRVSYICTICRRKFKRMATLTRHMKNIHDDFFDSKNQSNKRKNTSDSPQQKKKFIGDGSRKRNLDQNEERKKITRKEFKCSLCSEFFKTPAALNRHGINVHDLNSKHSKGEKRKEFQGKDIPRQYVKRQKKEGKPTIQYVNYF